MLKVGVVYLLTSIMLKVGSRMSGRHHVGESLDIRDVFGDDRKLLTSSFQLGFYIGCVWLTDS